MMSPVFAGILIGGKSRRFGRPKHLVLKDGKTWLERTVDAVHPHVDGIVILGKGEVPAGLDAIPVLFDVPGLQGPLAGMLAATRWRPAASWVFLPCDLPSLSGNAVSWLVEQGLPGVKAVLPRLPGAAAPEPLLAYYDATAAPLLEQVRRPMDLAGADGVISPEIPAHLRASWTNVNTPADLPPRTHASACTREARRKQKEGA